jgi:hypothetical protein
VKTHVYVDGFNLYYGALRGTGFKWLDIAEMCRLLLPAHDIRQVAYFTARVNRRPADPDQPLRQLLYLRALGTIPSIRIVYGHFLTTRVTMPLAGGPPGTRQTARVIKTEEKGSDVNLATHLLWDGVRERYEAAVLVTNDSDLLEPVRIVRHELGRTVGILNPHRNPSRMLLRHATFVKSIRKGVLAASQFPAVLHDAHGRFTKPASW